MAASHERTHRIREFVKNVTSRRDTPPVRTGRPSTITPSPELTFLTSGELIKLTKGAPLQVAGIAASLVFGRERNFTQDSTRLAESIEQANIIGAENIPTTTAPLIIASNHPDLYDLVAGTVHITNTVNSVRSNNAVPGEIHWLITDAIPHRDIRRKYRKMYQAIDWGLRRLNQTYNFISVPIDTEKQADKTQRRGRIRALFAAREQLQHPTGSKIVGIFPEGDITKGETLSPFYKGVGVLAKTTQPSDEAAGVAILPTGISRIDGKLTIQFGAPIEVKDGESVENITDRVKTSVSDVSHNHSVANTP